MTRLARRLSRHVDTQTIARLAADLGLTMTCEPARGAGHPRAILSKGDRRTYVPLASSPGRQCPKAIRARVLRRLKAHGLA